MRLSRPQMKLHSSRWSSGRVPHMFPCDCNTAPWCWSTPSPTDKYWYIFFFFSYFAIERRRWEEVSHDVKVWLVYLLADQKRKRRLLLSPTIRNRMDMGERRAHNQRQINTETTMAAASSANGRTEKFKLLHLPLWKPHNFHGLFQHSRLVCLCCVTSSD